MSFTKIWVFFRLNQHGQGKVCSDVSMLFSSTAPQAIWALVPDLKGPIDDYPGLPFLVGVYVGTLGRGQVTLNRHDSNGT